MYNLKSIFPKATLAVTVILMFACSRLHFQFTIVRNLFLNRLHKNMKIGCKYLIRQEHVAPLSIETCPVKEIYSVHVQAIELRNSKCTSRMHRTSGGNTDR